MVEPDSLEDNLEEMHRIEKEQKALWGNSMETDEISNLLSETKKKLQTSLIFDDEEINDNKYTSNAKNLMNDRDQSSLSKIKSQELFSKQQK